MNEARAIGRAGRVGLLIALAGCGAAAPQGAGTSPPTLAAATTTAPTVTLSAAPSARPTPTATARPTTMPTATPRQFPTAIFAGLSDEPVSAELAAELQEVLDTSADGVGLTATLITAQGTWSGATGFAAGDRAMVPNDQMSIASITKTLVAAQVMQLVQAGELALDDFAADRLPPDLEFDTNGATIENLLSMRSGIPENLQDPEDWESLTTDPLRVWLPEDVLATVGPERSPAGQAFEYRGNNFLLLGLIVEQVTGRPLAEVLRDGVLDGDGYERLIFQPDERPSDPVAMPDGAAADTFDEIGGYLPALAAASALGADGNMASDSISLALWWRALCAGEVVSPASLNEMTDFRRRPEYGLGLMERSGEYWPDSGALGHTGLLFGYTTAALCFQDPGSIVVVLANGEHDVDTAAGDLVRATSP